MRRARHVDLAPADRGRLHDLLRSVHRHVHAGRPGEAARAAETAGRLVGGGGLDRREIAIEDLTVEWQDVGERFVVAWWRDPPAGLAAAVRFGLGPEHFPSSNLWHLAQSLAVCVDFKLEPTVAVLVELVRAAGGDITAPELQEIEWLESGPAGLENYGAILVDFARRRLLAAELSRLRDGLFNRFEPLSETVSAIQAAADAAFAEDLAAPPPARKPTEPWRPATLKARPGRNGGRRHG